MRIHGSILLAALLLAGAAWCAEDVITLTDGRTVTGKASDTDTMVAAAYAYVSALNKLLVKREKHANEGSSLFTLHFSHFLF